MDNSAVSPWVRVEADLLDDAKALGVPVDDVVASSGEHGEPASPRRLLSLWELLSARSRDPFFGVHVAEQAQSAPRPYDATQQALAGARTVSEALANLVRRMRIAGETSEANLGIVGEVAVLVSGPRGFGWTWPRQYAEYTLATYLLALRNWTGLALRPRLVTFQHPAPQDASELRRIFGCELRFGANRNRMELDRGILTLALRPPVTAPTRTTEIAEGPRAGENASQAIRRILRDRLHDGAPTLPDMARALSTSARTLQRRLASEGVEYRRLVEEVRREAAMAALQGKHVTVEAAAEIAGYADARAFRRAVVRWTGRSPKALRTLGLVQPGGPR